MIRRQFYLSLAQIARYAKLDPSEIVAAIKAGELPARTFLKPGANNTVVTSYKVAQDDLVAWLRAHDRLFDEDGEMVIQPEKRRGPQAGRMLKVWCESCGLIVRMSNQWIEATAPRCFNPNCEQHGTPLSVEGVTREVREGDDDVAA